VKSLRAVVAGRQDRLRAAALADRLADRLKVPYPFSAEVYQQVLSDVVGTPIRLLPFAQTIHSTVSTLTGMTLPLNQTIYIFYRSDTSPIHQLHVIHHELFHALRQHPGIPIDNPNLKDVLVEILSPELPHLNRELIQHLVGRGYAKCHDDDKHERDAERFAVAVARRMGLTGPRSSSGGADTDKLGRLLSDGHL
jgi:hypothetical protein